MHFVQTASTIAGKFVRNILLQASSVSCGLAISPDSAHMVVSHGDRTLSVYALPSGEHIRTFGGNGSGKGQFDHPAKLCFSVTGNILVAERWNSRVQEVTLAGDHVRFIGDYVIDGSIFSIAANAELVVVGKYDSTSNDRIMMFDAVTGEHVRSFGKHGDVLGQLSSDCCGIRFTPDGRHIIVAANSGTRTQGRVSVFTLAGEFVRCIGMGPLKAAFDVDFADNGDIIVCGRYWCHLFSADLRTQLRRWGGEFESDTGQLRELAALAMCGDLLYVLDNSKSVRVFA